MPGTLTGTPPRSRNDAPARRGTPRAAIGALRNYESLAIKQKEGILAYQAFPRPWDKGEDRWSEQEWHDLGVITSDIQERSESMWNGRASEAASASGGAGR